MIRPILQILCNSQCGWPQSLNHEMGKIRDAPLFSRAFAETVPLYYNVLTFVRVPNLPRLHEASVGLPEHRRRLMEQ